MRNVFILGIAVVLLATGIALFARYAELGQIVFDGQGIGIFGWEVLNEEVPLYRGYILAAALALSTAAGCLLVISIRVLRGKAS